MKLMWTLCLTWSLFYAADALQCQTCSDSTDVLSANQLCLSATLEASVMATSSSLNFETKLPVPPATCAILGNEAFSANLGIVKGAASSFCCKTDGCNSKTKSFGLRVERETIERETIWSFVPAQQGNNNLTCFTCDSLKDHDCKKKLQCVGIVDRCIKGSVRTGVSSSIYTFGCVSANICKPAVISQLADIEIPLASSIVNFIEEPNCCEENLCNSGSILSLSILPLLMAPLTFTLTF